MQIAKPSLPNHLEKVDDVMDLFDNDDMIENVAIENSWLTTDMLEKTTIVESTLSKIDFSQVNTLRFAISDCELKGCNFAGTVLAESSWLRVSIEGARCSGLQVTNGLLRNVLFKNSKLEIVNFRFSKLDNVRFEECVLDDVDFYSAQLKNVEFVNCTINRITFASAKMTNVDISESVVEGTLGLASLRGVTISYDQLMQLAPSFATDAGIKVK